jgi:hypothetical protein
MSLADSVRQESDCAAALKIRIPHWVPLVIKSEVREWLEKYAHEYREHPRDLEVLRRLVTARRMKHVWHQLGGQPPPKLKQFFFIAYDAACHRRPMATGPRLDDIAAKLRSNAKQRRRAGDTGTADVLEKAAQAALAQRRGYGASGGFVGPLKVEAKTSKGLEEHRGGWRPPLITVRRDEGEKNNASRTYVLELADLARKLFSTVPENSGRLPKTPVFFLKTIATTASVALKRDIDRNKVRHWVEKAPRS